MGAPPRSRSPVDEMVPFVIGPGSHTVPDINRKLPGRGLWITGTRAAIEEAVKGNVFARSLKQNVRGGAGLTGTRAAIEDALKANVVARSFKQNARVAADLAATTERMLERSALDALAI